MKYFYKIVTVAFLLISSTLILNTPINIFPEVFFSSWLVYKGLIPFRDFFEHHGFLLYYILAPLTVVKSFILMKVFYLAIQLINLSLVLFILRRVNSRLLFFLCGFLYLLINYIFSESNLRYETIIVTLYLLAYIILISKSFRYKYYVLGIIAAAASFTKITAGLIIIPILLLTRNLKVLVSFLFCLELAFIYFFINKSIHQFVDGIILFNRYLSEVYTFNIVIPKLLLAPSLLILMFSILIIVITGKIKKIIVPLFFTLSTIIFMFSGFGLYYYVPIVTFIVILIAYIVSHIIIKSLRTLIVIFIVFNIVFLLLETKYNFRIYNQRTPWIENIESKKIISELNRLGLDKNSQIYIFGNEVEIYYFLDQLPPSYFTSFFYPFKTYYNFDEKVASEVKNKGIVYIIRTKPMFQYINEYPIISKFIDTYYTPLVIRDEYQIYELNKAKSEEIL